MAQGAVAAMATNGNGTALTAEELREILEYEKIIQFRDAIFAGTHPRIKIPPHVLQQHSATRNFASPTAPRVNNSLSQPTQSTPHFEDQSSYFRSPNNNRQAVNGQVSKTGKSEINPILLEKSDDLIKAEMQLQRNRLERALRDQIEQHRITAKATQQQSESLPNFDISEVLSKAQALVNPSTEAQQDQPTADDEPAAASDSFDENTFYSSQHDSSEWSNSSPGQKEQGEMQSHGLVSVDERPVEVSPARNHAEQPERAMNSLSTNNLAEQSQHLQSQADRSQNELQNSQPVMSGALVAERTSSNSGSQDSERGRGGRSSVNARNNGDREIVQSTSDQLIRQAFEQDQASPLIRAHNLSPVAPQPARVSPLATAREPPILRENIVIDDAQPAQVTALRNQPAGMSSVDSSPKGARKSEKKRDKKKKRKAKDNADTPESPYIKAEPRSPSPFPVAPLPRPQKRQRQSDTYGSGAELNYDEPTRYEPAQPAQARPAERYLERRESGAYERREDRYEPEFRRPPAIRRIEEDNYRRVSSPLSVRRQESPRVYALPPSEVRHARAASLAIVDRREEPRYYREPVIRASVRPDADRERSRSPIMRDQRSPLTMAPPRQPVRIIIDEHGREYIDPASTAVSRQSVAPVSRYREPEVIYDRGPVRTVSGRPPVGTFEEDGVIYRRASPAPRRVVTEPEYAMPPPDYHSYRERDYPTRPTLPPGDEYVQIRGGPDRRPIAQYEEPVREYVSRDQVVREEPVREYARPIIREEIPREYSARAMSVRPEAVRYIRDEPPRGYARAPSVRPDAGTRYEVRDEIPREYDTLAPSRHSGAIRYEEAPREYAPRLQSVRPEGPREYAPREIVQRVERAYSVVPVDASGRRETMPPPGGERYYEEPPRGRPSEVAFIERPRARESSVVVYADDVRREVYR
ncbi:hypothetical protein BGZ60DRAFT_417900 [Tricladium varicosporioides]|nr:hypothetical protein BGZ60DRAFT_417900 [Hymenoscyphus varicosporioides]